MVELFIVNILVLQRYLYHILLEVYSLLRVACVLFVALLFFTLQAGRFYVLFLKHFLLPHLLLSHIIYYIRASYQLKTLFQLLYFLRLANTFTLGAPNYRQLIFQLLYSILIILYLFAFLVDNCLLVEGRKIIGRWPYPDSNFEWVILGMHISFLIKGGDVCELVIAPTFSRVEVCLINLRNDFAFVIVIHNFDMKTIFACLSHTIYQL